MLAGKNVLLGVTGGIAAYKAVDLASRLIKEGAQVKVIMTESAVEFVSPLTFRALTQQSVVTKLFNAAAPIEHISLADWSDIVVIAPATANIIGKIACGIADDLLSTTIMAATSPKVIVPAMNVHMWENEIVQENISKLDEKGYFIVPPDKGKLACGYEGEGRFPDPKDILPFIKSFLHYKKDFIGTTILITAGACREYIDPMRYLSNLSSGKMGLALSEAAYHRGANVILIHSEMQEEIPYYLQNKIGAITSDEMYQQTKANTDKADIVIMTAAVTDFKPEQSSAIKIKKSAHKSSLEFVPTVDTLQEVYNNKRAEQIVVGFAAESDNLVENARKKLKKCDLIVVNDISVAGKNDTALTIQSPEKEEAVISGNKFAAAHKILDVLAGKLSQNNPNPDKPQ